MSNILFAGVATKTITKNKKSNNPYKFSGFVQLGVEDGDKRINFDRIRLNGEYTVDSWSGKLVLDLAKETNDNGAIGVPDLIKDLFIAYKLDNTFIFKMGVIKTPIGMSSTVSRWNLDLIQRGFDNKLVFDRAVGVMFSGRNIGFGDNAKINGLEIGHEKSMHGLGYDFMISGSTGRSGAVDSKLDEEVSESNQDNGYMGRIHFDWGEAFHSEIAYGEVKGNTDSSGKYYNVLNLGLDSYFDKMNLKAEYFDVDNIRGIDNWNMNTLALTATYYVTDRVKLAVKSVSGIETKGAKEEDARNTYFGLNYYINPKSSSMDKASRRSRNNHRIQLNYVVADVDKEFHGVGGLFKEDAILAQYQFKF